MRHTEKCQAELHKWGAANAVTFEDTKESITILSRSDPAGPAFKNMGILFDPGLYMENSIESLRSKVNWKLRTLLRTSRFFTTAEIVHLYKARILSFIEYRTAAVYHGTSTSLVRIDEVQNRLINSAGISKVDAIMHFKLAPLNARRGMAMLELIHRSVIGSGPEHFRKFFKRIETPRNPGGRENMRRHKMQLETFRKGNFLELLAHSVLGLIDI